MDGHRFDRLTRDLAIVATRRGLLRSLAAAGLAAAGLRRPVRAAPPPCVPGSACTGTNDCCPGEQCDAGLCRAGPGSKCPDERRCGHAGCCPQGERCLGRSADRTCCPLGRVCGEVCLAAPCPSPCQACDPAANGCVPVAGCCTSAADCDDGLPCTTDTCGANNRCTNTRIADCCTGDDECATTDPCSADSCDIPDGAAAGTCRHDPIEDCCTTNADCTDSNACTTDTCGDDNRCTNVGIPNCCTSDDQCATNDPCTTDACDIPDGAAAGTCRHDPILDCCLSNADCDDDNPCTTDACGADNRCINTRITGGGTLSCGVGACARAVDRCVDGVEQTCTPGAPSEEVCDGIDNDCDGEVDEGTGGAPCTSPECPAGGVEECQDGELVCVCEIRPCFADSQCVDGDPCTEDRCVFTGGEDEPGACVSTEIADCRTCSSHDECDDGDPCTADFCFVEDGGEGEFSAGGVRALPAAAQVSFGRCASQPACHSSDPCEACTCSPDPGDPTSPFCSCGPKCAEGEACHQGRCYVPGVCAAEQAFTCELSFEAYQLGVCGPDPNVLCHCYATPAGRQTCALEEFCNETVPCGPNGECFAGRVCVMSCCGPAIGGGDGCCDDGNLYPRCFRPCPGLPAPACTAGSDCDDFNECTVDTCGSAGSCRYDDVADGTPCNGGSGTCGGGQCLPECSSDSNCVDGDPCTEDRCIVPAGYTTGICEHVAIEGCMTCAMDRDCPADQYCKNGVCSLFEVCGAPPHGCPFDHREFVCGKSGRDFPLDVCLCGDELGASTTGCFVPAICNSEETIPCGPGGPACPGELACVASCCGPFGFPAYICQARC